MIFFYIFYFVNSQKFSINFNQNLMHIDQNAHLQTLYDTLIQT